MGNNGPLYGDEMTALRKATSNVGELFLVDDHAPVSWIEESNHALAEAARDWPHTTLIDWKTVAGAHDNLLWDDIHLTPAGAGVYARLVSSAVHEEISFPPRPMREAKAKKPKRDAKPKPKSKGEAKPKPQSKPKQAKPEKKKAKKAGAGA
jgi:hypothetical protein